METLQETFEQLNVTQTSGINAKARLDILCTLCQSLFSNTLCMGPGGPDCATRHGQYHHHITELRRTAEEGCHLCNLIVGQIDAGRDYNFPEDFPIDDFRPWIMMWMRVEEEQIDADSDNDDADSCPPLHAFYYLLIHRERPREQIGSIGEVFCSIASEDESKSLDDRVFSKNTKSKESLDRAEEWLSDCLVNHKDCRAVEEKRRNYQRQQSLPTRLLDLTRLSTASSVAIIATELLSSDTKYITLSYCWGSSQNLMLTTESMSELQAGFSVSRLPQTFQDAAWMAVQLGCSYLWIDSLCIIQDSHSDWLAESATMASVYANGLLNLAAGVARDPTGGLFSARNPLALAACYIEAFCECTEKQMMFCSADFISSADEPLYRRGWVMQELALAQRVIKFGGAMLSWQCHTQSATENGTLRWRGDLVKRWLGGLECVEMSLEDLPPDTDLISWRSREQQNRMLSPLPAWTIIVSNYSAMKLTFDSDKLVAIAGLARQLHISTGDSLGRYLAGLWELDLIVQLNWRAASADECRRPTVYRAPTWSWASVDGPVRSGGPTHIEWRYDCLIESVSTTPVLDPYGAVTAGNLLMLGRLCHITLQPKAPANPQSQGQSSRLPKRYMKVQDNLYDIEDLWISEDDADFWSSTLDASLELYIMPLFEERHAWVDWGFQGLLLLATGRGDAQYVRVGLVNPTDLMAGVLRETMAQQNLSSELHRGRDEQGRYHVEIV